MTDQIQKEMVWNRDGHTMHLQLNKHEVVLTHVDCPETDDRACQHITAGCLVQWFLGRFGLDCNVGFAEPAGSMEIAWTVVGETSDLDMCQVWIIPVNDEAFAAWLMTQS